MAPSAILSALLVVATLGSSASAQCLDWRTFPYVPPPVLGQVSDSCVHDDGSGPALYFNTSGDPSSRLLRWDGTQLTTVSDGLPSSNIRDLVSFDDGSGPALYACGRLNFAGIPGDSYLARWNGASWQLVGGVSPNYLVDDIEIHDDGSGPALFVGGGFTSVGAVPAGGVAKWDGSTWSVVGPVPGFVWYQPIGRLASHHDANGPALCAWSNELTAWSSSRGYALWRGSTWTTMPGAPSGSNSALRSWDDGSGPAVYAASSISIYRWKNGTWQLNAPAIGFANTLEVLDLGSGPSLCAGVSSVGFSVRTWNGTAWSNVTPEIETGCGNESVWTIAAFDTGHGPELYAGGVRGAIGTVETGLTRWNGSAWVNLGPPRRGIDGTVRALTTYDAGAGPELYAGGFLCGADDQATSSVVRWDGTGWRSVGQSYAFDVFDVVTFETYAVAGQDQLFAGSNYGEMWSWDGTTWTLRKGTVFPYSNRVYALQAFQGELYVGGTFTTLSGWPSNNIARWTPSGLQPVGTGTSDAPPHFVGTLTAHDDGSGLALYAGGIFTSAGGVPLANIGRWDGSAWSALGSGTNGIVDTLVSYDEGNGAKLYAGGVFTDAGGVAVTNVARWDGTSWSPVGAGLPGQVLSLGVYDDGSGSALYAGGTFPQPSGPEQHIARWNGVAWTFLGAGTNGAVWAIHPHDDGIGSGPELFVGGEFTRAGLRDSNDIAAWRGCGGEIARFCFGDGSTANCPCENNSPTTRGCANSANASGARMYGIGSPPADTIELVVGGELPNAATLVFQGDVLLSTPILFGDGLRCVGGNLLRLYTTNAVSGSLVVPGVGQPSIRTRSAALGDPLVTGSIRAYQSWYRDANASFCGPPAGNAWNLSNAVRVVW